MSTVESRRPVTTSLAKTSSVRFDLASEHPVVLPDQAAQATIETLYTENGLLRKQHAALARKVGTLEQLVGHYQLTTSKQELSLPVLASRINPSARRIADIFVAEPFSISVEPTPIDIYQLPRYHYPTNNTNSDAYYGLLDEIYRGRVEHRNFDIPLTRQVILAMGRIASSEECQREFISILQESLCVVPPLVYEILDHRYSFTARRDLQSARKVAKMLRYPLPPEKVGKVTDEALQFLRHPRLSRQVAELLDEQINEWGN